MQKAWQHQKPGVPAPPESGFTTHPIPTGSLGFGHFGGDAGGIRAAKPGVERSDTPG